MKFHAIAGFALCPILGSALAVAFRPSELDLRSFAKASSPSIRRARLGIPGLGHLNLILVGHPLLAK